MKIEEIKELIDLLKKEKVLQFEGNGIKLTFASIAFANDIEDLAIKALNKEKQELSIPPLQKTETSIGTGEVPKEDKLNSEQKAFLGGHNEEDLFYSS